MLQETPQKIIFNFKECIYTTLSLFSHVIKTFFEKSDLWKCFFYLLQSLCFTCVCISFPFFVVPVLSTEEETCQSFIHLCEFSFGCSVLSSFATVLKKSERMLLKECDLAITLQTTHRPYSEPSSWRSGLAEKVSCTKNIPFPLWKFSVFALIADCG